METLTDGIVRSVWGGRWVKYDYLPARGIAGGILVMWDDGKLECVEILKGEFIISMKFRNFGNGAMGEGSKEMFWKEVGEGLGR